MNRHLRTNSGDLGAPIAALAFCAIFSQLSACGTSGSSGTTTSTGGTATDTAAADTTSDALDFGDTSTAADTATADSTTADSSAPDTSPADTSTTADTTTADTTTADTATADATTAADTTTADTTSMDVGTTDTSTNDAAADAGTTDSTADTGTTDTGTTDTSTTDTNTADTNTADAGSTWGAFTKLSCARQVNKNTDGTVNPYISPARDGQFYVSYVQKGGDLMLNWEDPNACKTTEGPLQVNKTKGDVYYWGGVAVLSDLNGNFYAVWESNTKNADISFAWSKTGKTFSAPIELVSTSKNGQDPTLWTSGPGKLHAGWRGLHPTLTQYDPYYAAGLDVFSSKPFATGVMVHGDAGQDDQVALVTDSKGNIYFGWQSFDGDIFISKSTDAGKTWSKPVQVNDVKGKANAGKANFMVITPDDRIVMAWWDKRKQKSGNEDDVFSDSSADGVTWGSDVQINDNDARYQQDPSLVVGQGPGCKGAVYAVWQDFRSKKSFDIYMSRSVDGGKTWDKNQAVASDLEGDEMNPAIAIDNTCVIGVAWRDGSKNKNFDIGTAYFKW